MYFVGVDVGTGSARAGLFSSEGGLVRHTSREIKTWTGPEVGHSEQSTTDIWNAVCSAIREVCADLNSLSEVKGLGFTATCSLVAVDPAGDPVTVSLTRDPERNVILWQDHRAMREAEEINQTGHGVLRFVGSHISPEMQPPKLLWLKRNLLSECWEKAGHFFDLADYLTYRATGSTSRSLCCVVCKWTYIGHSPNKSTGLVQGWNESFWKAIGLADLVSEGFSRIGTDILPPGTSVGHGLKEGVADEFGLLPKTPVGTAIVDAHAGGLGTVGADLSRVEGFNKVPLTSRLALIAGTSSCHMASSERPIYVDGMWGPYYSVMVPGLFLSEGGQSSAGQLLEHVVTHFSSKLYNELEAGAATRHFTVFDELERILRTMAGNQSLEDLSLLTSDLHVYPDYVGNRSPLADPTLKGMVTGLTLNNTMEDLGIRYLATLQALAYGTRSIIEEMNKKGHKIEVLMICGGLRKNSLYLSLHADITGLPVLLTEQEEAVLAGSAILAAAAAGDQVMNAMTKMTRVSTKPGALILPCSSVTLKRFHKKKYAVFQELCKDQLKYRELMDSKS